LQTKVKKREIFSKIITEIRYRLKIPEGLFEKKSITNKMKKKNVMSRKLKLAVGQNGIEIKRFSGVTDKNIPSEAPNKVRLRLINCPSLPTLLVFSIITWRIRKIGVKSHRVRCSKIKLWDPIV
jgi:hypothetical protein